MKREILRPGCKVEFHSFSNEKSNWIIDVTSYRVRVEIDQFWGL